MKAGKQEQICVKLDQSSYAQLELTSAISGIPRNRLINRAVIAYCQTYDIMRGYANGLYKEKQIIVWFLKVLVPYIASSSKVSENINILERAE